jgi:cob(I)alamin adenosyltransferase
LKLFLGDSAVRFPATTYYKESHAERGRMKIYTGRGDDGLTDLRDMSQVSKSSSRIEAYGTVDEVNALVGVVRPTGYDDIDDILRSVQNHLHVIQADFATPEPDEDDPVITDEHVEAVEDWIDEIDEELDPLEKFILPSGSVPGAKLHHARAVCRRAERRAVDLANAVAEANEDAESDSETPVINKQAIVYLNRLSDLLFTLARAVNKREGVREENPTY